MFLILTFQCVVKFNENFKLQSLLNQNFKTNILAHVTKTNKTLSSFVYRCKQANTSGEKMHLGLLAMKKIVSFVSKQKQKCIFGHPTS